MPFCGLPTWDVPYTHTPHPRCYYGARTFPVDCPAHTRLPAYRAPHYTLIGCLPHPPAHTHAHHLPHLYMCAFPHQLDPHRAHHARAQPFLLPAAPTIPAGPRLYHPHNQLGRVPLGLVLTHPPHITHCSTYTFPMLLLFQTPTPNYLPPLLPHHLHPPDRMPHTPSHRTLPHPTPPPHSQDPTVASLGSAAFPCMPNIPVSLPTHIHALPTPYIHTHCIDSVPTAIPTPA